MGMVTQREQPGHVGLRTRILRQRRIQSHKMNISLLSMKWYPVKVERNKMKLH